MDLPVMPPLSPMLAKGVAKVPDGDGIYFEPKWDGFRCLVFRDGDEVELVSRHGQPLTRYFPELLGPFRGSLPSRCVVDGEIVIATADGLDFDALGERIHPADSRVQKLAAETPASFVAFDILALADRNLMAEPFSERRRILEATLATARPPVRLTPITNDPAVATDWFHRFEGAGLDGVMAKAGALAYLPNERVMLKIKHQRTADVVVAGFRTHKSGDGIGSLLLGLFDDEGQLHHVGVASSFTAAKRRALVDELAPLRDGALDDHPWRSWAEAEAHEGFQRLPGSPSRWNAKKNLAWEPLRPELVVEVGYQHLQRSRFRNPTKLLRFRPDRTPESCTYAQLETVVPYELKEIFGLTAPEA